MVAALRVDTPFGQRDVLERVRAFDSLKKATMRRLRFASMSILLAGRNDRRLIIRPS
jgi:hypothetical protein